jgi:hypothetical protein
MNKRADFTNLGGFPLEQDTLDFMQQSYRTAFGAIAKMCGDKSILYGVELIAGSYTNGWISYNGELIPFIGAVAASDVVITETAAATQAVFEDGTIRDVYFTKTATCGSAGSFPMAQLVPLFSLQNIWLPGDIKQKQVENAYIAANFDATGFGTNREKGWRIMSAAYPTSAGRVFVNLDPADTDFDTAGKLKGEKTRSLTAANNGPHVHTFQLNENGTNNSVNFPSVTDNVNIGVSTGNTASSGNGEAFDIIQPSYVVLTLIKL